MKIAIKFFEKSFVDEVSKNAYMKACKWVAKYIISKVEIGETFWNITKVEKANSPTFKLELYAMLDDTDFENGFCNRCQEFHKSFFINQQFNCNKCNMKAYQNQIKQKLDTKKGYRMERLKYLLENLEDE